MCRYIEMSLQDILRLIQLARLVSMDTKMLLMKEGWR